MRYAGINKNDFSAAPGVSVSFFTQGCPHRCPGCHNPETWDYEGGKDFTPKVIDEILEALSANGINRSLAIMGGEPLCENNCFLTLLLIKNIKEKSPKTKIYVWTGYYYDDLLKTGNPYVKQILDLANVLIDGPYIEAQRDLTLPMRGSSNQNIINLTNE
jgi:anaerobic ribonucleoside-triphosphate reductase activating protein